MSSYMTVTRELLQTFVPFNSLSVEYLDKAFAKVSTREFLKGAQIFKQGERIEESFFLLKGKVELAGNNHVTKLIDVNSEACQYALNQTSPATGNAIAKSRVQVFSIERELLDLLLTWSQSGEFSLTDLQHHHIDVNDHEDEVDWMSSLLQSPLLQKVPPANIQQLFAHFESVQVDAGRAVVREGESGDYFYVIEAGKAQVSSKGSNSSVMLQPGQYFGEEALVGNTPRNATVSMKTPGHLMRINKAAFTKLLQEPVIRSINFDDIEAVVGSQVVDVRLPIEHRHSSVAGSMNIPLGRLRKQFEHFTKGQRLVVTDDGGHRSQVAVHLLCQAGFDSCILQDADQHYV